MTEIILCKQCGEKMVALNKEHTIGMNCPKCGWGFVTSHFNTIETDDTDYSIFIQPKNLASVSNIKLLSDIAGINFLQAKKLIDSKDSQLIYRSENLSACTESKAQQVLLVAKKLKKAGIVFFITPDFPFDV